MKRWKDILSNTFGKRSRKKWKVVAVDILLVDCGVKKAYLFDQWLCEKNEMELLLMDLHRQGLIRNRLGILSVECDLMIFSPYHLRPLSLLCEPQIIVDISPTLAQPAIMHEEETQQYSPSRQVFDDFLDFLSHKSDEAPDLSSSAVMGYEIHVSSVVNPTYLFGLSLGYPVIYWYSREGREENCLEMQPLRLYLVRGYERDDLNKLVRSGSDSVLASSDAFELKLKKADQSTAHCIPCGNISSVEILGDPARSEHSKFCISQKQITVSPSSEERPSSNTHTIFSFTVPENVHTKDLEACVERWFSTWRSCVPWTSLFSEVWMEGKLVEPQAVCL